jgi:malonyl-CoA O-methyltransferase
VSSSELIKNHHLKKRVAAHFGLKAEKYSEFAHFQRHLLTVIASDIKSSATPDSSIFDLGCGVGLLSEVLGQHKSNLTVTGIDIAFNSLRMRKNVTNAPSVCADLEQLPLQPDSADIIVVSSVLQWIDNHTAFIHNLSKVMKKQGFLFFSTFVNDSFYELAHARKQIGLTLPVRIPTDIQITDLLTDSGFIVTKRELVKKTYYFPTVKQALQSLSSYGATATTKQLTRKELSTLFSIYEEQFKCQSGIPVTYEAIAGISIKE